MPPARPESPSRVHAAALAYLACGWSVIPVQPRSKRPLVAWQVYQQAPPSAADVAHWFDRWPDANVAVVTGAISNLVVVDVDPRHGGADSLAELERRHGPLPATVEAVTGGGRHLYFAYPSSPGDGRLPNRVDLVTGIDVRADGGLVVAPPSIHASGRPYRWESGRSPEQRAPACLPDWLLQRLVADAHGRARPPAYWRDVLTAGVAEGRRNDTIASLAGHLLSHDIDPAQVVELLLCWNRVRCRPPLPDDEVARTVESIGRLHDRGSHA